MAERAVAIQEARLNSGAYIDYPPQVLKTLQAGKIDSYLIYEKVMLQKIEAQAGRIDFVQVQMNELFEE